MIEPDVEDQVRARLRRIAGHVQPGQLHPLRVPARRRRSVRMLVPAVAVCAVCAVIAVVAVVAVVLGVRGTPQASFPASPPHVAAKPRYYISFASSDSEVGVRIGVHDSVTGRETGSETIPGMRGGFDTVYATSADGRTFYLTGAQKGVYGVYRMRVSAAGQPGTVVRLPEAVPSRALVPEGVAVSPDGKMLAISLRLFPELGEWSGTAGLEVIDLATGTTRTWTSGTDQSNWPGPPVWVDGDTAVAFPWWQTPLHGPRLAGVKLVDVDAPGNGLVLARVFPVAPVSDFFKDALVTAGGDIIEASCPNSASANGTVTAQITEAPVGAAGPTRLLLSRTVNYRTIGAESGLAGLCDVLSADASGQHLLVSAYGFGRIDDGRFTPLPVTSGQLSIDGAAW
jgi:hypothetical protein